MSLPVQENAGENEADRPSADAVLTVSDYEAGFAIRHCHGPRDSMNWQAGVLTTEYRNYLVHPARGGVPEVWFSGHVSLFHLKGVGNCREDALRMAKQSGRNGR